MGSRHSSALAVGLGGALLTTLLCTCGSSHDPPRGAILIVVDTLRADHVGAYGATSNLTPRLDALASRALVFRNAVAVSSWTKPSVASMLTGRYPTSIAVLTEIDAISEEVDTLSEMLAPAGVRSFAISSNGHAGVDYGFGQGFESFDTDLERVGYPSGKRQMVPAEAITRRALETVDGIGDEDPFFLFLHYTDPHSPYLPHPGLLDEEEPAGRFTGSQKDLKLINAQNDEHTETDRARIRYLYAGEVKYCDRWLGELFDGLEERGLLDDVLLVITSDHGEGLWDHGARGHRQDLYEEIIQVPLVVLFPPRLSPRPQQVDAFASHVDIAPTILGALGLTPPEHLQGRDLGAAVRDGTIAPRGDFAYSEMTHLERGIDLESISDGRSKIIRDRSFDGGPAKPFEYVVKEGENLGMLAKHFLNSRGQVGRILRHNPGLKDLADDPRTIEPEPGTVIEIPARRRIKGEDLLEVYKLVDDPREQIDLSEGMDEPAASLIPLMRRMTADNLAQRIEGRKIRPEDLDPKTLEQLKGLGYLGN